MKCSHCHAEVPQGDKFCGNCGTAITPSEGMHRVIRDEQTPSTGGRERNRCAACGHLNDSAAAYCESCGTFIAERPGEKEVSSQSRQKKAGEHKSPVSANTLGFFQSWKLTVGLAAVFVVVLVLIGTSRDQEPHQHEEGTADLSAHAAQMKAEIEQLQKRVEADPRDSEAMLSLANRLHDVRSFPQAVAMYQQYLQSKPADTDARVDLGICYFEIALTDESIRSEYFIKAQKEMREALTYDPKHQLAHFNLGIVFLQSGNMQDANLWFKKCIDLNPETETGKRARELYNQHQSLNIQ